MIVNKYSNGGGGGSGTTNYNALTNKPQIAGVTLSGNTSLDTLGAATKRNIQFSENTSEITDYTAGTITYTTISSKFEPDTGSPIALYTTHTGDMTSGWLNTGVTNTMIANNASDESKTLVVMYKLAGEDSYTADTIVVMYNAVEVGHKSASDFAPNAFLYIGMVGYSAVMVYFNEQTQYRVQISTAQDYFILSGNWYEILSITEKGYQYYDGTNWANLIPDISGKQDALTAGSGITIVNNVISATGGGGGGLTYVKTSEWTTAIGQAVYANPKSYVIHNDQYGNDMCYYAGDNGGSPMFKAASISRGEGMDPDYCYVGGRTITVNSNGTLSNNGFTSYAALKGKPITIGSTTLNEQQLIALLALLPSE